MFDNRPTAAELRVMRAEAAAVRAQLEAAEERTADVVVLPVPVTVTAVAS